MSLPAAANDDVATQPSWDDVDPAVTEANDLRDQARSALASGGRDSATDLLEQAKMKAETIVNKTTRSKVVSEIDAELAELATAAAQSDAEALVSAVQSSLDDGSLNEAEQKWREAQLAVDKLGNGRGRSSLQSRLTLLLAEMHYAQFESTQERRHLDHAESTVRDYLRSSGAEQRPPAEELLKKIEAARANLEPEPTSEPQAVGSTDSGQAADSQPPDNRAAKALMGTGGALVGLSLVGVGIAAGGAAKAGDARDDYSAGPTRADRNAAEDEGKAANAMIIGGSIAAAVLATTGVALILVGAKKRVKPSVALLPDASLTGGGFVLRGSF